MDVLPLFFKIDEFCQRFEPIRRSREHRKQLHLSSILAGRFEFGRVSNSMPNHGCAVKLKSVKSSVGVTVCGVKVKPLVTTANV